MKLLPNQKQEVERYINSEFKTESYMNNHSDLVKVLQENEILKVFKDKYDFNPGKNSFFIFSFLLTTISIKQATELFGKGTRPGKLGEGNARCWIFEVQGKKMILFIDRCGSSIEFEPGDFKNCFRELILFLLDNPTESFLEIIKIQEGKPKSFIKRFLD